jgi:hypothetical protein
MKKYTPKRFIPPISERQTNELVGMANGTLDFWQEEAIRQAREELEKRGITAEYERKLIDKWQKKAERQEKAERERRFKNQFESYPLGDKVLIFLSAPVILIKPVSRTGESLFELKQENYRLKYKQRLVCLVSGVLFWAALILITGIVFH